MSLTKIPTAHERAIELLKPGTGSTLLLTAGPVQELQATLASYHIATFRIRDCYDDWELGDLLQTLADRGADYTHEEGIFEVRIPAEFDPQPYIAAMEIATDAITEVELQTELRTEICGPQEE